MIFSHFLAFWRFFRYRRIIPDTGGVNSILTMEKFTVENRKLRFVGDAGDAGDVRGERGRFFGKKLRKNLPS